MYIFLFCKSQTNNFNEKHNKTRQLGPIPWVQTIRVKIYHTNHLIFGEFYGLIRFYIFAWISTLGFDCRQKKRMMKHKT